MVDEDLRVEDDPRREDVALLDARLDEFNAAASGVDDGRSLAIFVREADGRSRRVCTGGPGVEPD